MSWSSYKNRLIATIEGIEGYRRIPLNRVPEKASTAYNHKAFELKWRGMTKIQYTTGNKLHFVNKVLLTVKYKNVDPDESDANADLIIGLIDTLKDDNYFQGFAQEPTVTDIDEKHIKMETIFYYGQECI